MAVSVCMATFNGAAYIKPQLESILCQLNPGDELIVSDDGSTDATLSIVCDMRDERIRLLRGPGKGAYANFSFALSHARKEFVFLADQDDIWEPTKISSQLYGMQDELMSVSDAIIVDKDNNVLHQSYSAVNRSGPGFLRNFVRSSFLGCCMSFKKSLLEIALPIPSGVAHDWWLGMIATLTGKVVYDPRPLVRYRRHENNSSVAGSNRTRRLSQKLTDRLRLGVALLQARGPHAL